MQTRSGAACDKTLRDMDRKFGNERTPEQAFDKPGFRAGVNE